MFVWRALRPFCLSCGFDYIRSMKYCQSIDFIIQDVESFFVSMIRITVTFEDVVRMNMVRDGVKTMIKMRDNWQGGTTYERRKTVRCKKTWTELRIVTESTFELKVSSVIKSF